MADPFASFVLTVYVIEYPTKYEDVTKYNEDTGKPYIKKVRVPNSPNKQPPLKVYDYRGREITNIHSFEVIYNVGVGFNGVKNGRAPGPHPITIEYDPIFNGSGFNLNGCTIQAMANEVICKKEDLPKPTGYVRIKRNDHIHDEMLEEVRYETS